MEFVLLEAQLWHLQEPVQPQLMIARCGCLQTMHQDRRCAVCDILWPEQVAGNINWCVPNLEVTTVADEIKSDMMTALHELCASRPEIKSCLSAI